MKFRLLFTNFNTIILGIIMFIVGFVNLIVGAFKFVLISVVMALAGLFLIASDIEKRRG